MDLGSVLDQVGADLGELAVGEGGLGGLEVVGMRRMFRARASYCEGN